MSPLIYYRDGLKITQKDIERYFTRWSMGNAGKPSKLLIPPRIKLTKPAINSLKMLNIDIVKHKSYNGHRYMELI